MSRVLVVGARGMLGASLCPRLEAAGHYLLRQSRGGGFDLRFDPSDGQAWRSVLSKQRLDAVVNLAAATDVDRCEREPQWAYDANVGPVLAFEQAARDVGVRPHLVHISSDHVYDGAGPHEEDSARPCNVYALSKLAAELATREHPSTVLRTNFFGASRAPERRSFSDWIVGSLRAAVPITVFDDVLFSSLHLDTLCDVVACALDTRPCGTFNVGTTDGISKAGFALALADRLGLSTAALRVGSVADVSLHARRPLDMRMDSARFEQAFGMPAPTMTEQINHAVGDYFEQQTRL
jgi:dTDP-4-dehydrorhamnose reductase